MLFQVVADGHLTELLGTVCHKHVCRHFSPSSVDTLHTDISWALSLGKKTCHEWPSPHSGSGRRDVKSPRLDYSRRLPDWHRRINKIRPIRQYHPIQEGHQSLLWTRKQPKVRPHRQHRGTQSWTLSVNCRTWQKRGTAPR